MVEVMERPSELRTSEWNLSQRPNPTQPTIMNANILKILTWNVRGASHPLFHDHLMETINKHHPGILILVENKLAQELSKFVDDYLKPIFNVQIQRVTKVESGCCGILLRYKLLSFRKLHK